MESSATIVKILYSSCFALSWIAIGVAVANAEVLEYKAVAESVEGVEAEAFAIQSFAENSSPLAAQLSEFRNNPVPLANVKIDTNLNNLQYEIPEVIMESQAKVTVHGFAPEGWKSAPLFDAITDNSGRGIWNYPEAYEKNIIDGLAYVVITSDQLPAEIRGQIEPIVPPLIQFPADLAAMDVAGECHLRATIEGVAEDLEFEMEPAQVSIIRGIARDEDGDGRRDLPLEIDVRVGDGIAPGIGRVDVEMLEVENPGSVEAINVGQDFPANMKLSLRKRYKTSAGNFVSERENYVALGITRFPPFGALLFPTQEKVKLFDESTGEEVGYITPGTITPLINVDSDDFPHSEIFSIAPTRDYPRYMTEMSEALRQEVVEAWNR